MLTEKDIAVITETFRNLHDYEYALENIDKGSEVLLDVRPTGQPDRYVKNIRLSNHCAKDILTPMIAGCIETLTSFGAVYDGPSKEET